MLLSRTLGFPVSLCAFHYLDVFQLIEVMNFHVHIPIYILCFQDDYKNKISFQVQTIPRYKAEVSLVLQNEFTAESLKGMCESVPQPPFLHSTCPLCFSSLWDS